MSSEDKILYRRKFQKIWVQIPVLERASPKWIKVLLPDNKEPTWIMKDWKHFRELSYLEGLGKPLPVVSMVCSKGVRKLARYPDLRRRLNV